MKKIKKSLLEYFVEWSHTRGHNRKRQWTIARYNVPERENSIKKCGKNVEMLKMKNDKV